MIKLGNLYVNRGSMGELCCSADKLPIWWQRVTINDKGEIFKYEKSTKSEYQNEVVHEKKEESHQHESFQPSSVKFDPVLSKQKL